MRKHILLLSLSIGTGLLLIHSPFFRTTGSTNEPGRRTASDHSARLSDQITIRAIAQRNPGINPGIGRDLVTSYVGSSQSRQILEQNLAEPAALLAADFDEDGTSDLIAAYAGSTGGILTLHRGNVDAIYANSPAAKRRKAEGTFVESPFHSPARIFDLPERPDLLATGDFDADGHADIVTVARSSNSLYLLSGDGRGGFASPTKIDLPGRVTALVSGEINRADGLADLAIGLVGTEGAQLLVFEGPEGALRSRPEAHRLPAPAPGLAIAEITEDYSADVAVAAGRELLIIEGRDRKLSLDQTKQAEVERATIAHKRLPFSPVAISAGNFTGGTGEELALLADDGTLHLLRRLQAKRKDHSASRTTEWKSEIFAKGSWSSAARLICARVSNNGADDLLIADPSRDQLDVVTRQSALSTRHSAVSGGSITAALESEDGWTALLPMRLNGDALTDLVVLRQNQVAPAVVVTPYATFSVTSSGDAGAGTLREAIILANATPGPDLIDFNILPTGPNTISLLSALPNITGPVTIDGTTQPGFNGAPIIELNGSSLPPGTNGLFITGGNTTIRGLVINRLPGTGDGIEIQANGGNVVEGNYIGTDLTGNVALPNGGNGVFVNGPPGNRIGGTAAASQNVISGNGRAGIAVSGINSTGNLVQGNFIGTDATGTAALGNTLGVNVQLQAVTTIGGTVSGARNFISGNATFGIGLGFSSGNLVQGNFIGTDVTGTLGLGNSQMGVQATTASANNTFGGTAPAAGNIVSANGQHGFQIRQTGSDGNLVQGNLIGTQIDGTTSLPNQGLGVAIENTANNNSIGGAVSRAGNVVAFNAGAGVAIVSGTGNSILGNAIFLNEGMGIDLGLDGVTLNDAGDGDTGANNLQNFPVLAAANSGVGGTAIAGDLNSTPLTSFRIEFFSSVSCDDSGNGEGQVFVGSTNITTDAVGNGTINTTIPAAVPGGGTLTATATGPGGNTSEFSSCIVVTGPSTSADIAVTKSGTPNPVISGNTITYSLIVTNFGPDDGTGAALTENIPANTTFQSIVAPTGWTCTTPPAGGTGAVNCTNPILVPAEIANFSFVVQVNPATSGGTVITNTASASSNVPDPNPANNSASTTTLIAGAPTCTVICPPSITVSANSTECGAAVKYQAPVAAGICGAITCTPASGSFFAVGTKTVTCTAASGPVCSFTVRVVDNTPPLVFCPTGIVQPIDPGQQTAVVSYALPSTTDNCPGLVTVCTPPSGASFPLGVTPVSCRVTDAANNVSNCSFTVTVNDNQPPTIVCPANVVVNPQPGQCSPVVNYPAPTVSDNLPGATVACVPPSGSAFPVGTATITCSAMDVAGNRASCSFTVTVGGGLPQARITIPGGRTVVEFGNPAAVPARRKPLKAKKLPCASFAIENVGFSPLVLTLNGIVRTGADVDGHRITDPDDSKIFAVKIINADQSQTPVNPEVVLIIQPCQARTFCATFNPVIPAAAGKTTGLSADEVLPDTVTSAIVFQQAGAGQVAVNLVGHVATELLLINPDNPRKQPTVEFTRSGNEFVLTTSIFDSNMDVRSARYEFLDRSGQVVDQPFDIDLIQPLRDLNLVRGQSFVIEQRFSGAASHPEVASVRVTVTDGQSSVSATAQLGNQSTAAAALVSLSRFGGAVVRLPGIKLKDVVP